MVMGWTKYSPEGFVFTAKLPQLITHEKMLGLNQGVQKDLQTFIELMEPLSLSGKLGCTLIQLPPKLVYQPREMEAFFRILPTHVKFAVEFRNHSWMRQETWDLLRKYKVAYTIVDEPLLAPEVHLTSNIAYFRWHGHGSRPWFDYQYDASELEPWIPKVKEVAGKVEKTYGYFNNHYHGYAVENCLQVMEMLGVLTPEQTKAKSRVESYFKESQKLAESTLETFVEPAETSFDRLIRFFIDVPRLRRAEEIRDSELAISSQTDKRIEATIREYHIVIDLEAKEILHDCADWERVSLNKKLCKHIGKLLLTLDREKALETLKQLYDQLEEWQFKTLSA